MSMDHTPLEAVRVAAFGFDRPEGAGDGQNGANGEGSGQAGTTRPPRGAEGLDGRTAETERNDRDAEFFQRGWMSALREIRFRGDRPVEEFLVEQLEES